MLYWISHAKKLLSVRELCCAPAIEPNDSSLDTDKVYGAEDIVSVCAGLVTLDKDSQIIRLVHYTTQDYFVYLGQSWYPKAQEDIATACLTYLCFDEFRAGACITPEAFESRLQSNPFYMYSARFWAEHIRPVQDVISPHLLLAFLSKRFLVDSAAEAGAYKDGRP